MSFLLQKGAKVCPIFLQSSNTGIACEEARLGNQLEGAHKVPGLLLGLMRLSVTHHLDSDRNGRKLTKQKYMGKQAAQYEPEDPHYVMSTDSRGKKKRMVVSSVRGRR
jgi:hypothetical protein